jgi:hypothetical protein
VVTVVRRSVVIVIGLFLVAGVSVGLTISVTEGIVAIISLLDVLCSTVETGVTVLSGPWVVAGTEPCAPAGMSETVVTISGSWAVASVTERVALSSVVRAVRAIPVWKALTEVTGGVLIDVGMICTGCAIVRRYIDSCTWVLAPVARKVALLCAIGSSPPGDTLAFLAVLILKDPLGAFNTLAAVAS